MTPENFCYWLQGFFELSHAQSLSAEQGAQIREHLNLVFNKVTPNYNNSIDPFEYINSGFNRTSTKKDTTYCAGIEAVVVDGSTPCISC